MSQSPHNQKKKQKKEDYRGIRGVVLRNGAHDVGVRSDRELVARRARFCVAARRVRPERRVDGEVSLALLGLEPPADAVRRARSVKGVGSLVQPEGGVAGGEGDGVGSCWVRNLVRSTPYNVIAEMCFFFMFPLRNT